MTLEQWAREVTKWIRSIAADPACDQCSHMHCIAVRGARNMPEPPINDREPGITGSITGGGR